MLPNLEILDAPDYSIWKLPSFAVLLPKSLKDLTLRKAVGDDVHQRLITLLKQRDQFVPSLQSLTLDLHWHPEYLPPYLQKLQSACTECGVSLFVVGGDGKRDLVMARLRSIGII
jgi:hypothetical protein